MSAYNTQLLTCAKLITDAARAGFLKKAVLSKHTSPDTVKTTLTVRQIGGKNCLQGESMHTDNKAKHQNIAIGDDDALLALLAILLELVFNWFIIRRLP